MRLKGRVVLITGAGRGIGRAVALTFAREGATVIVNYSKSRDQAEDVVREISELGRKAIAIQADIANQADVYHMVDEAINEFERIDIIVNNAGIVWRTKDILKASKTEWETVLGVNLLGTYYCIQAIAPHMIKQKYGKIINIASISGIGTTVGGQVAYASSKASIIIVTRKLAYALGPHNINVNAIAPGTIQTDMLSVGRSIEELQKRVEYSTKTAALRRIGNPQDIANTALFLASDESSFITGQVIVVDGGRSNYLSHS